MIYDSRGNMRRVRAVLHRAGPEVREMAVRDVPEERDPDIAVHRVTGARYGTAARNGKGGQVLAVTLTCSCGAVVHGTGFKRESADRKAMAAWRAHKGPGVRKTKGQE